MNSSLNNRELKTIYKTLCRLESFKRNNKKELSKIFTENPRLIITPSNRCNLSCLHCVANSTPFGEVMDYEKFSKINSEFFKIFSAVDFGRRGNPLLYNSNSKDLSDMIIYLNKNGINTFTIANTIQRERIPIIEKLEKFSKQKNVNIETMITYHHYFNNFNSEKFAEDFNLTLKNYLGFSNKILISLLGDKYSQTNPTKEEEVKQEFEKNKKIIFKDISLTLNDKGYIAKYKEKTSEVIIPGIDHRVYPLGRFRNYLANKGILEKYEKQFEALMGDYVCPDLIKWPGIIIEPNGDLSLCASFEAINSKKAIVSNIFDRSYKQLKKELIRFQNKETNWFFNNLSGIIEGKCSTCKIKTNCYN